MEMPTFIKEKTCFFSGHRPYKFAFEPEKEKEFLTELKEKIAKTIRELFEGGYDTFICGGIYGFDVMCGEAVLELKKEFPHIRLVCMLPFENHHTDYPNEWQGRFLKILDTCDFIDYISPVKVAGCYYDRNQKMVEASSHMVTYFDGRGGGTARVVASAQSGKLKITNLYENQPLPENITYFVGYDSNYDFNNK